MSSKAKKRLCWNCEGNVAAKADICPYCGVSLEVSKMKETETAADTLAPPYKMVGSVTDSSIPSAPYASQNTPEASPKAETETISHGNDLRTLTVSLIALLLGSVFVLFSILLALFSNSNGVLALQWSATYWYIYLILGIPLLFIGWRACSQIQDKDEDS